MSYNDLLEKTFTKEPWLVNYDDFKFEITVKKNITKTQFKVQFQGQKK